MATGEGDGFSAYMRAGLEAHRWKVAELARRTGFNRQTLSEWINQGVPPNFAADAILKIARAFGDDPAEAYRAWAGLPSPVVPDPDIDLIVTALTDPDAVLIATSDWPKERKAQMIRRLLAQRGPAPEPPRAKGEAAG